MDKSTYTSLHESYREIYSEMTYDAPPPSRPAEMRPASNSQKGNDGYKVDATRSRGTAAAGAGVVAAAAALANRKKKGKNPKGDGTKFNMSGGSSDSKPKSQFQKNKEAYKKSQEIESKRVSNINQKSKEKKPAGSSSDSARASLERSLSKSPSSSSKSDTKKSDSSKSDRAKSDAYFKKAAERYRQGGGGNKEVNDKDRRNKTGGQNEVSEDLKELRRQKILESMRRCKLRH